jgi:pyridoxal phosphate enzyme (YggS family)
MDGYPDPARMDGWIRVLVGAGFPACTSFHANYWPVDFMSSKRSELPSASEVAENLAEVQQRIADAARRVGRMPQEVTLVAVSKTKPMSLVQAAYAAGQRDFGENRVEELVEKVAEARELGLAEMRWHLIGTIQSRKSSQAIGPFVLIHSVDRMKIARRLSRDAQAADRTMPVLLEVNVSGEASKHGFDPENISALVPALQELPGIRVEGLMSMAPLVEDAEEVRPVFRNLRLLQERLQGSYPSMSWRHLSMGMTNDFEVAVEEGATIVRVGTAIFGKRAYNK